MIRHRYRWAAAALLAAAGFGVWSTGTASVDPKPIGAKAGLDPQVVKELASRDIVVAPISDASAIAPGLAVAAVREDFGFVVGAATPTVTLVRFTDPNYGPVQRDDTVSPSYVDKEAWAVVYRGIQTPVIGCPLGFGCPLTTLSDFVVFVDARTGECLWARAIGIEG